jgi:hypothetical protein
MDPERRRRFPAFIDARTAVTTLQQTKANRFRLRTTGNTTRVKAPSSGDS